MQGPRKLSSTLHQEVGYTQGFDEEALLPLRPETAGVNSKPQLHMLHKLLTLPINRTKSVLPVMFLHVLF